MNLHQFGLVVEATWGTAATADRFFEIMPGESLMRRQTILQPEGLRSGQLVRRGSKRLQTKNDAGGSVSLEIPTTQFGLILEHMLGVTTKTTSGTKTVQHTATVGKLNGKSLTLQKGVEKTDGNIQAFTYPGSKIMSWEISNSVDGILMCNLTFDCKEEEVSTALATVAIPALSYFHFAQGKIVVAGNTIATVSDFSVQGTNGLDTDRYFLGSGVNKLEQREMEFRSYSGSCTAEFENITDLYNLFVGDKESTLVITYTGAEIESGHNFEFEISIPGIRPTGDTPKIDGTDVADISFPFDVGELDTGVSAVSLRYKTTDATP